MAWMSDEQYELMQDTKEKSITARSARYTRGHCGKGGKVILPSDRLSAKELKKMNGECKTYRLGSPMSWTEFKDMPNDLKVMYIKKLRKKFNIPDEELAVAMGVDILEFQLCLHKLGLSSRHAIVNGCNWYDTDDHGRFQTWWIIKEDKE